MYIFHGVDFTYYKNRGWQFNYCSKDGCYYAYEVTNRLVSKVVIAPSPQELHNRITDYKPMGV